MIRVAILGGSGYTAVELMKLLLRHPQAEIAAVTSRQEAGKPVGEIHASLTNRVKIDCEVFDADALKSKGITCAFGCLPHGVSAEVVGPLLDRGIKVIDLSADFRLKNPDEYAEWYGAPHHDLKNLGHAVYGLPELNREAIRTATLIANPGCYPQTAILGLAPLVATKRLHLDSIIIDSKSGVSGAGRQPKLGTLYPECNESFSAYNVGRHRHTPEIEQLLGQVAGQPLKVIFTPHLTPMDRGIFSTIYATPNTAVTEAELYELYYSFYAKEPFVRIRKDLPATKDSAHTNYLDIALRTVRGRVIVLASEDNLIRGASGVALQNFNIMHGFDESAGLV
jgi:N-acetyl-gamma-glutamyl-phosphate reductase